MRHQEDHARARAERRLFEVFERLSIAREEQGIIEEQLIVLEEMADEAKVRAVVAETPLAEREWREAQGHVVAMQKTRDTLAEHMGALEREQDELFSQLIG